MKIHINLETKILLAIDERANYGRRIAKKLDTYVGSVATLLPRMEKEGLISSEKIGRKKIVKLTPKGEKAKFLLNQLLTL